MLATNDTQNYFDFDNHEVFTHIDQWEKHSIGIIQFVAEQTRNDLRQIFTQKRRLLAHLLNHLSEESNQTIPSNHKSKLNSSERLLRRFQTELANLQSKVHLVRDENVQPIYSIKLSNKPEKINTDREEQEINVPGTETLDVKKFDQQPLDVQKQMLGERLFVLVQQIEPKLTAKVTGMFLELDTKHVLTLIKSPEILRTKIQEALRILQVHEYRQKYVNKA